VETKEIAATIEEGCIRCLNYFAIFKYPLTAEEVCKFSTIEASQAQVNTTLACLYDKNLVYKIDGFFLTENKPTWVEERLKGNQRAVQLLSKSGKYVRIIAGFPFVKSIAISGSLSKFYASKEADIDYFIITEANRLWIARTLLHVFKKLTFITGHQHYFCMNYFVDTNSLEITHQNLYSAIETVTLLPAYNISLLENFQNNNLWTKNFLPNFNTEPAKNYLIKNRARPIRKLVESVINIFAPRRLNSFLMNLTDRKWRRKWKEHNYSEEDYNRAFQTEISISKNHPADFEKKVLNELADNAN
jgi:hypothetical protein